MDSEQSEPTTVDEYIAGCPPQARALLHQIRSMIQQAAPDAQETISYKIAAFKLNGRALIYFAGFKDHVSLYPAPSGVAEFEEDMARYQTGRGTVRFPLDKPLPLDLIERIVEFRIRDNLERAQGGRKK